MLWKISLQPQGYASLTSERFTPVALNQQVPQIKDLPHQCRASTTLLEFYAGVSWFFFIETTLYSDWLQSIPCFVKNEIQGRKKKFCICYIKGSLCSFELLPSYKREAMTHIKHQSQRILNFFFLLQPFTAPHRNYYWGVSQQQPLHHQLLPHSSSTTPNETGMLSLSQLMQFFILCNFLPLTWKTNTSLLSKNILKHCQQLSTQSKTTITTQCEYTIEAAFLVRQIFKEFLRTAQKITQVTKRKGCCIIAKRTLLCHHETQPNV